MYDKEINKIINSKKVTLSLPSFLLSPNDSFHFVRRTITEQENLAYHDHDYAEIFWIKEGEGIHIVNGEYYKIKEGDMCLVRPSDTHTFLSAGAKSSLILSNIAFYLETLDIFKQRYFPNSNNFFWTKDKLPFITKLTVEQLSEVSALSDYILTKDRDNFNLDYFLLNIFKLLLNKIDLSSDDIPHWLNVAIIKYKSPNNFRKGVKGFVELTGRSTDYVNKTIKKHLNQTLTETVTKIKMNYAAQRLSMTTVPIKIICYNCGFKAIGYFYKTFRKYYGMTPNEYRAINMKMF